MRREEYAAAEEPLPPCPTAGPTGTLCGRYLRRTGRGREAAELWERRLAQCRDGGLRVIGKPSGAGLQAERLEDGPAGRPH